ncbi:hypothetical protein BDW62DRAFT_200285 [Aspergillus aurantiobrunneus]
MVDDLAFCKYLAHSLCHLNHEVVRQMRPKAAESRECIEEIRDTNHPGLITEGLMAQLLPFGEQNAWKSFEKHMRDEVNYDDTKLPWRRSPLWFVIRVALQTILYRVFPYCKGRTEYKNFMLYLAFEIGSVAQGQQFRDLPDILALILAKISRRVYKLQDETLEFKRKQRQTLGLPKLENGDNLSLLDLEGWVDTGLQAWRANTNPTDKACCDVAELTAKYSGYVSQKYAQMPDAMSSAILVLLELWVALDSLCIGLCPWLKDFSPEIPKKFLEPHDVEEYIRLRHQQCSNTIKSVFADPGPDTFAARYYDKTRIHRRNRENIEKLATHKCEDLRKKWEEMSNRYQDLISQASDLSHESDFDEYDTEIHQPLCEKCRLEREATTRGR